MRDQLNYSNSSLYSWLVWLMEPPLLFVFIITISALVIDSQSQPPPPLSSPPPPVVSSPPLPSRYRRPPPTHPRPPSSVNSTRPPPPPPPPLQNVLRAPFPPRPKGHDNKRDVGRKIGLLFVGVAGVLQIGVVGFLVFKRNQILKVKDGS